MNPRFLPILDAASYTGMSRRFLDYAKDHGELPYVRKGRKILFDRNDLDTWMLRDRIDVTGAVTALGAGAESSSQQ